MLRWKVRAGAAMVSVLALLAVVSGGTGAGAATSTPKPTQGGTLTLGYNNEAAVLDPVRIFSSNAGGAQDPVYMALFGALVYEDYASKAVKPMLAESFKTIDNGHTWVLKLRSGLKFSDGTPLDSAAVKFNWDRMNDASTGSQFLALYKSFTYTVDDPTQLTLILGQQNNLFDRQVAQSGGMNYLGSPKAFADLKAGFGNTPVGAGPFMYKEWIKQNRLTVVRNPNYFDKPRPYLDTINFLYLPLEDQRWNAFEGGQLDMMWTSRFQDFGAASSNPNMGQTLFRQIGWQGLIFNVSIPPVNDVTVRQALAEATNAAQAAAAGWPGKPNGADGMWQKWTPYYGGPFPKTDLVDAQKKIDAYMQKTGQTSLKLQLTHPANNAYTNMATVLKSQWERLKGVSVTLIPMTVTLTGSSTPMIGPAVIVGCCNGDIAFARYATKGTNNQTGYSNSQVDAAFYEARASTDPKVQNAAWKRIGQLMAQDIPVLPVANYAPDGYVYYKKVGGIVGFSNAGFRPDLIYVKS